MIVQARREGRATAAARPAARVWEVILRVGLNGRDLIFSSGSLSLWQPGKQTASRFNRIPDRVGQFLPTALVGFYGEQPVAGEGNNHSGIEISPGHAGALPEMSKGFFTAAFSHPRSGFFRRSLQATQVEPISPAHFPLHGMV